MFPKPSKRQKKPSRLGRNPDRLDLEHAYLEYVKPAFLAGLARGQMRITPLCERCRRRSASEVHHRRGRVAGALVDATAFAGLCTVCHLDVESNRLQAIEDGWSESRLSLAQSIEDISGEAGYAGDAEAAASEDDADGDV